MNIAGEKKVTMSRFYILLCLPMPFILILFLKTCRCWNCDALPVYIGTKQIYDLGQTQTDILLTERKSIKTYLS